ncbi:MAG: cytochrome c bioproteinis protein, transmembrane region [Microgenomates group bacterium Gr01-1014_16]|nr:MAG: cytochrome c bioproteinis protein, transmembrane region [Microgenomates group bacterium Gr01-1014_16]
MNLTLPVVTFAALLDSINPCAISVLLLTIGFLVSLKKSPKHIMAVTGVYILGIFITYILIGLGILQALTFFGISRAITKFGALILVITGILGLVGVPLGIPGFIKPRLALLIQKATYPAMFALGILVGLFEFPCTGGPYLMILALLHDRATFTSGALYLIYYNLIFISPLIVISLLTNNQQLLTGFQAWRHSHAKTADLYSSIAMIVLGGVIFLL